MTFVYIGLLVLALIFFFALYLRGRARAPLALARVAQNPILEPIAEHAWESEGVFNPAAIYEGGRVHLLYRALGSDGISRIGYASSKDGIHFDERLPYPIYSPTRDFGVPAKPKGPLSYDTVVYPSGGGWGGSEDPRTVRIDDHVYMSFVAFDGWGFVRMALTSILHRNLLEKNWDWKKPAFLSPPGEIQKNWLLFPKKINGKYAILHSISPQVRIAYVNDLDEFDGTKFIEGSYRSGGRPEHWDKSVRGAGAPPIETPEGWLLFYHAMDPGDPSVGYKVGALLLDKDDPSVVRYRSKAPVLEPTQWYENDWKPGVVYVSGAVVVGSDLLVYYGGGDKRIAVAKVNLRTFLQALTHGEHAVLT